MRMRRMLAALGAAGLVVGFAVAGPASSATAEESTDDNVRPLQSTTVVISEVQTHGPTTNDRLVEIRNISPNTVDISGYTVQRCTQAGVPALTATIPAGTAALQPRGMTGQFFLIAPIALGTPSVTPDLVDPLSNLVADGGVQLRDNTNQVVDAVAFLGTAPGSACLEAVPTDNAPAGTNPANLSVQRNVFGTDTDNNFNDFGLMIRTPQSSTTPPLS